MLVMVYPQYRERLLGVREEEPEMERGKDCFEIVSSSS
jgi:hypothetical protein